MQTIDYKLKSRRGCCISTTVGVAISTSDANRISLYDSKVCSNNILAGERRRRLSLRLAAALSNLGDACPKFVQLVLTGGIAGRKRWFILAEPRLALCRH